jgi:hypothetical protein
LHRSCEGLDATSCRSVRDRSLRWCRLGAAECDPPSASRPGGRRHADAPYRVTWPSTMRDLATVKSRVPCTHGHCPMGGRGPEDRSGSLRRAPVTRPQRTRDASIGESVPERCRVRRPQILGKVDRPEGQDQDRGRRRHLKPQPGPGPCRAGPEGPDRRQGRLDQSQPQPGPGPLRAGPGSPDRLQGRQHDARLRAIGRDGGRGARILQTPGRPNRGPQGRSRREASVRRCQRTVRPGGHPPRIRTGPRVPIGYRRQDRSPPIRPAARVRSRDHSSEIQNT